MCDYDIIIWEGGVQRMAEVTLASILTDIGSIVTSAVSWMGSIVTFITSNPLVLMFVVLSVVGLGIGLLRRVLGL